MPPYPATLTVKGFILINVCFPLLLYKNKTEEPLLKLLEY